MHWLPKGKACGNVLHSYPLPANIAFGQVSVEIARRLVHGWQNPECPDCGMFGWIPPQEVKDGQGKQAQGKAD